MILLAIAVWSKPSRYRKKVYPITVKKKWVETFIQILHSLMTFKTMPRQKIKQWDVFFIQDMFNYLFYLLLSTISLVNDYFFTISIQSFNMWLSALLPCSIGPVKKSVWHRTSQFSLTQVLAAKINKTFVKFLELCRDILRELGQWNHPCNTGLLKTFTNRI